MNQAQSLDSRLNIEGQMVAVVEDATPAVVPVHLGRARPLHRLGEARQKEDFTRHTIARRLGITVEEVRRQECETTDLPLSVLHKWAEVLHVPVTELLQEPSDSLSMPLFDRAHMVLVMKTAMAILEWARDPRTTRLAQTMVEQLTEIMPELRGVSAWPTVGKSRRGLDELGSAVERGLSMDSVNVRAMASETST
jgi:transcriptional regulator with XRE-family HTH domain